MMTEHDVQSFKSFMDAGGILYVKLFGQEPLIMQKIGGYYSLYREHATRQIPMTVRQCLENLVTYYRQSITRYEKAQAKRFTFETVIAKKRSA